MSYPPGYYRYFELFNAEEFWEAHEALEEIWQETDDDKFLRGLIVFAAAFVHVQRNNPSGCRKVLEKCIAWLTPFAPSRWDLDLDRVLAHARLCLALLDQVPPGGVSRGQCEFSAAGEGRPEGGVSRGQCEFSAAGEGRPPEGAHLRDYIPFIRLSLESEQAGA